jgi:peptide/nickel transport system substrate-binding protein/oligopeptide transport system substrate-binding protein
VAIKAIGLTKLNAQQMIDATDTYNRELLFGRQLKHPHLPAFHDSFTDQDHWYLVVQYIDGPTLETYVEQKPGQRLALWEVLDIGIQVCDVLTYLHTRHPPVIFRDIKPDNIMRSANGNVYLVDFGIARHFRPGQRRDTQLLGSPGYAAPEQYGSSQTDERSDIYSLGITLQTLLTGHNPLEDKTNATPSYVGSMSSDVEALLKRMYAQKREDRPASVQEVRNALQDIAREQGISSLLSPMRSMQSFATPTGSLPSSSFYPYTGNQASQMAVPAVPPYAPPAKRKRSSARWIVGGLVASVLVCVFGSMILPNFSSPSQPVVALDKHTLAIGMVGSSSSEVSDPVRYANSQDQQVMTMLYSSLTTVNSQNKIMPGLAQSWDAKPDADGQGLDWTFHLRPNLKFSDGSPLTSSDVAYSIDRVFSAPDNEYAYLAPFFKDGTKRLQGNPKTLLGDSLLTPNSSTLIIKEQGRGVFLPAMMSTYCFLVVKQSLVREGNGGATGFLDIDKAGSSGPFMLSSNVSSTTGPSVTQLDLVPNPSYYGNRPQLKKVLVRIYSSSDDERADYKANRLSMMLSADHQSLAEIERSDEQFAMLAANNYIGMNYLVKPFDNIKIRQAFALALDKPALLSDADQTGLLATNHIIPRKQQAYNESLTGPAGVNSVHGDITLARKLLQQGMKEEGIQGIQNFPPVTLSYYNAGSICTSDKMRIVQQQWNTKLGINVQLDTSGDVSKKINESVNNPHGLQTWCGEWTVDYPDPQNWTSLLFGKGSSWNTGNYGQNQSEAAHAQQQVQADLLKADALQDPQQRLKLYQDVEQKLVNDVAWLPIAQDNQINLIKANVQGYQTNENGFASPEIMQSVYINE